MTKKQSSRATKVVLASLLAASLSIPTAASANIGTSDKAATTIAATVATDQVIDFHVYKPGTNEPQPAISGHIVPQGKLIEKDGEYEAQLTIPAKSAPMIAGLQTKQGETYVDATEVKNADGTITYSFPMATDTVYPGKIHVVVAAANMDHWYDFDFKAQVAKEEAEAVKNVAVQVFKDGTSEESIMKNYMSPTASVKKVTNGNEVTVTFPKGHYIQEFKIDGKKIAIATEDKSTDERTYTFNVADLTKLVDAELHVIVDEAGVKYDSNHKVQIGLDGVKPSDKPVVNPTPSANPFKDIDKDGNKAAILALYEKGIVKGADQFNPRNNITRSQFALMVARALDLNSTQSAGFKDIANITDKERVGAINALAEAGIVKKGDKFNPNNTLTRQQGALMLYRAVNYAAGKEMSYGDTSLSYYADRALITDPETKKAFALLYAGDIMTGSKTTDGKTVINPGSPLKRTQMAKILNGSLEFMEK
ncbi:MULTISPECIES: NEAT domain-containing protein [Sporosarcina]|uniref:Heme-binding NEAT domain-containing protein n=1 Tax=Sporosarcina newyorkensis TaxID=759851 RepID=A0A1T4YZE1_9BACL|nr:MULTISPECIES: NEAT domain-containing protein [Sporosarcina]MBY0223397.1 NEAT domain-containing protein [Sporosarcina aquimarina]SKB06681.1 Heme-binding NEAT domain-containing protein [Sporosarcina newyorkensis]